MICCLEDPVFLKKSEGFWMSCLAAMYRWAKAAAHTKWTMNKMSNVWEEMKTFYCEGKEVEEQENTEEGNRKKANSLWNRVMIKWKQTERVVKRLISLSMGSPRGNLLLPIPTLCKVVEKIQTECLQRQIGKCRRKKTNFGNGKFLLHISKDTSSTVVKNWERCLE